ncbi:hypothetical protein C8Q74DRAFT_592372 [Fomes fomentarius]|nr:hypothetical protein C8Q74DRAFT_592372 [Fomes fomentarius]
MNGQGVLDRRASDDLRVFQLDERGRYISHVRSPGMIYDADTYLPRRGAYAYVERRQDGPAVPVPGQAAQPEGVFDVSESVAASPDTGGFSLVIAAAAGGSAILILATIFIGYWIIKRRERLRRIDRSPPSPLPDAPRKARRRSIALSFSTSSSSSGTISELPLTSHIMEKIPLTPGFEPQLLSSNAFAVSPLGTTFPVPVHLPPEHSERRATWAEPGYLKDPILYTLEPNRFRDSMSDTATLATPAPFAHAKLEPNRYRDSMAESVATATATAIATPPPAHAKLGLVRILSGNLKRPPPIDVEQARTVRVEQTLDSGIRFVNDRGSRVFVPPPYTPR